MFVKTLMKLFNISKFMNIALPLFSKVQLFELDHYYCNFLPYSLLCPLTSTVQENNKNWKLRGDYIALD